MTMNDLIDGADIDIDCPECGQIVKVTVGELRRSPMLTCPQGHEIAIDGSEFDRDLRPADEALKELDDTIDKFGR